MLICDEQEIRHIQRSSGNSSSRDRGRLNHAGDFLDPKNKENKF